MKSELERIVKERTIECESLHRQLQESNQTKAKTEYSIRNLETELDELKRKMLKVQDDHKSIMEDKDADVRLMKKKMNSMERQQ
jgi:septal ring factor EnvC (AmiA/AmiB activator)